MTAGGSDSDDSHMNRRPSELNAATDLVGLGSVGGTPTISALKSKVDEADIDKKHPSANDDDLKLVKKDIVTAAITGTTSAMDDSSSNKEDTVAAAAAAPQDPGSSSGGDASVPALPGPSSAVGGGGGDSSIKTEEALQSEQHEAQAATLTTAAPQGPQQGQGEAGDDDDGEGPDGEKTAFPILLHEIVSEAVSDDCIHWLSCGTRFMISDKKRFAKDVLPRFYGHAKFTSFTRRLKRWSFTRVPSGPFMGAYYNANFRRGEPELAARVRYDHPAPLSGAAMQLNKAKLQAAGALGAGGMGAFGMNPLMAAAQGMPLSDGDREALLRQMNIMNQQQSMGMGIPGMQNMGLLAAMNQQGGNFAATNNTVALQMAMAQEMMQQRQAAQLLAQQQGQMNLLNAAGLNNQGQPNQGGNQGQPEDQRLLAAMFLDRLNKQQQGQGSQGSGLNLAGSNSNLQQQQAQAQALQNASFPGSSMPSVVSMGSSHPSGGLQGFNFAGQAGAGGLGAGNNNNNMISNQSPNNSGNNLSNNPLLNQANNSNASLTTLTGGRAQMNNMMNNAPQLNFPNNNNANNMGMGGGNMGGLPHGSAGSLPGMGGNQGGSAGALAGMGGGNTTNPAAMNALLADYLRRTSGAAPMGNDNGNNNNQGGGDGNNNDGDKTVSC